MTDCLHCSLPAKKDSQFCCLGCQTAYNIIHQLGLQHFYKLKKEELSVAAKNTKSSFAHFDDPSFIERFVRKDGELSEVTLHLSGVHCSACVWLLEKVREIKVGILGVRVDLLRSLAFVHFNPSQVKLSEIAILFNSLGYAPSPWIEQEREKIEKKAKRKEIFRLGVAALSAANVMMLAVSLYAGGFSVEEDSIKNLFSYLSLVISLPAVFYAALPFYRTSLAGLRLKRVHIDLPLSIGILSGFVLSTVNLINGREAIYYDSITVLIFLILVGRALQNLSASRVLDATRLLYTLTPLSARLIEVDGKEREVFVESLKAGDLVSVKAMEVIPVDGVIFEGQSRVSNAIISGESRPLEAAPGTLVWAASKNLSATVSVRVSAVGASTRIGEMMKLVERAGAARAPLEQITDRTSRYFVIAVLVLTVFTLLYWWRIDPSKAFDCALALLVITCPCALGLAVPLTFSVALARASKRGFLVRSGEVFERLCKITQIVFDKTGTLTGSELSIESLKRFDQTISDHQLYLKLIEMERGVEHPIARAIEQHALRNLSERQSTDLSLIQNSYSDFSSFEAKLKKLDPTLTQIELEAGRGVVASEGRDKKWLIGSCQLLSNHKFEISESVHQEIDRLISSQLIPVLVGRMLQLNSQNTERQVVAVLGVGESLSEEMPTLMNRLRSLGLNLMIASGDLKPIVERVGQKLGFEPEQIFSQLLPEAKVELVRTQRSHGALAFVGDGINDAAALKEAFVGIGVQGGAEASLRVADVYLAKDGVLGLEELLGGAKRSIKIIKRSLRFSLCYNFVCALLAMSGFISPLLAGVLMPLSSISVIALATLSKSY
jgi:Cu2+-exporting ATPase